MFRWVLLFTGMMMTTGNPFQRWTINLVDGGYENILVVISERVNRSQSTQIIENLKVCITLRNVLFQIILLYQRIMNTNYELMNAFN